MVCVCAVDLRSKCKPGFSVSALTTSTLAISGFQLKRFSVNKAGIEGFTDVNEPPVNVSVFLFAFVVFL